MTSSRLSKEEPVKRIVYRLCVIHLTDVTPMHRRIRNSFVFYHLWLDDPIA